MTAISVSRCVDGPSALGLTEKQLVQFGLQLLDLLQVQVTDRDDKIAVCRCVGQVQYQGFLGLLVCVELHRRRFG